VEEEGLFWTKGLLGCDSAECLLNTIYFYNGKLFVLRSNEHRLIRVSNIAVKDNFIIFDESVSKTFHGRLKDLKKSRRLIEYKCHEIGEEHSRCLVKFYSLYLEKIAVCIEANPNAFYFKPHRSGCFAYEKSAIGINTLAKILSDKLCAKAGIERKTSHCLRITCATRLFQRSVQEKQIRERTGHRSDSLFRYEKPSDEQVSFVSNVLPPMKETGSSVSDGSIFDEFGDFDVSD
jgi:integrase